VPVRDLLLALTKVGFITPPHEEADGYTFRLAPDHEDPLVAPCRLKTWGTSATPGRRHRGHCKISLGL
jgi:hypothetical protein